MKGQWPTLSNHARRRRLTTAEEKAAAVKIRRSSQFVWPRGRISIRPNNQIWPEKVSPEWPVRSLPYQQQGHSGKETKQPKNYPAGIGLISHNVVSKVHNHNNLSLLTELFACF